MKLYGYFRSSASYRVRIALNLKGLPHETVPVHLVRGGGEQFDPGYLQLNPQAQVPALVDDEVVITQSMAVVEYLEEIYPTPPLLPSDAGARARVRALCQVVACDIHPLNNLRVLHYLSGNLGLDETAKMRWYRHWVREGLAALEALLNRHPMTGTFCHGERPTMADLFLVPQIYNARRFNCPVQDYPTIVRIDANCRALPAFQAAAPEAQPDFA